MAGVDPHSKLPMVTAAAPYASWPNAWFKKTSTIVTDGGKMVRDGHKLWLVVHVPIPPTPPTLVLAALAILASSSEPFLCKRTVKGQGDALACCAVACVGVNANCTDLSPFSSLPSGVVLSITSVVTTPSAGDWAAAILGYAIDNVVGYLFGQARKAMGVDVDDLAMPIVQQAVQLTKSVTVHFLKQVSPEAAEVAEWVFDAAKKGTDLGKGEAQDAVQKFIDDNASELF
ncbi:MAG: hypothetical protein JRI55_14570 [Deltaproteobacteria bacterium]|nr:hypothetical protein [Deltaproteobacteria bacterium]